MLLHSSTVLKNVVKKKKAKKPAKRKILYFFGISPSSRCYCSTPVRRVVNDLHTLLKPASGVVWEGGRTELDSSDARI